MNSAIPPPPGQVSESLLAAIRNLVRVGVVSDPHAGSQTARVTFDDRDDLVSYDMQIIVKETAGTRDQWTPQMGQQVVCLFLPTGVEAGFILGSIYDDDQSPPFGSEDERGSAKSDGTVISYNTETHRARIENGPARATIDRDAIKASIGSASINMQDGEISVTVGSIEATWTAAGLDMKGGRITHNGTNIGDTHRHNGVRSGSDTSGGPT